MVKKNIIWIIIIVTITTVALLLFFIFKNYNSFPSIGITAKGPIHSINSNLKISATLKGADISIGLETDGIYPDSGYRIAADYKIVDGKIYVEIAGVEDQGGGLLQPQTSTYVFSIPQSASSYPLLIRSNRGEIDRFNMQIKEGKVLLIPTSTPQFTIIDPLNI